MKTNIDQSSNSTLSDQAQHWFLMLQSNPDDIELLQQFELWLAQAPEHEEQYLETCLLWQDMETAAQQLQDEHHEGAPSLQTSSQAATLQSDQQQPQQRSQQLTPTDSISDHFDNRDTQSRERSNATSWNSSLIAKGFTALAVSALALLVVVLLPPQIWHSPDYATPVGEQLSITLDDGSQVHLNGQTGIAVNFTESTRSIELLYGEAFFEVASDKNRPFQVISHHVTATAIGTAFNVRQLDNQVKTTLTEGRLKVTTVSFNSNQPKEAQLKAGQSITVTDSGQINHSSGHKLYLPDWKRKTIRLDDTPLSEVLERLNRQYSAQIILANPSLADKKMSGILPDNDLDFTLSLLNSSLGVDVIKITEQMVVLH